MKGTCRIASDPCENLHNLNKEETVTFSWSFQMHLVHNPAICSINALPPPPLPLFRCNSFSLLLMIPGYRYKQLVLNIQPNKSIWSYWICTTYMYSIKVNINMEDLFMLLPVVCTMCPHVYILMLHVNRIMMQVVKKKIYVNTFILHINIVYLACRDKSVPPYL